MKTETIYIDFLYTIDLTLPFFSDGATICVCLEENLPAEVVLPEHFSEHLAILRKYIRLPDTLVEFEEETALSLIERVYEVMGSRYQLIVLDKLEINPVPEFIKLMQEFSVDTITFDGYRAGLRVVLYDGSHVNISKIDNRSGQLILVSSDRRKHISLEAVRRSRFTGRFSRNNSLEKGFQFFTPWYVYRNESCCRLGAFVISKTYRRPLFCRSFLRDRLYQEKKMSDSLPFGLLCDAFEIEWVDAKFEETMRGTLELFARAAYRPEAGRRRSIAAANSSVRSFVKGFVRDEMSPELFAEIVAKYRDMPEFLKSLWECVAVYSCYTSLYFEGSAVAFEKFTRAVREHGSIDLASKYKAIENDIDHIFLYSMFVDLREACVRELIKLWDDTYNGLRLTLLSAYVADIAGLSARKPMLRPFALEIPQCAFCGAIFEWDN
jgi:hypothetical protein